MHGKIEGKTYFDVNKEQFVVTTHKLKTSLNHIIMLSCIVHGLV